MDKESRKKFMGSPREYLKSRRPERFSDSMIQDIGRLDRVVLEHHLASLNRRNQELDFENFAKQLCEKTICPNLLEQTGPVAGGDGKVDTQTYPVSEQAKLLWYVGINENADKDRWAFAVSTQEEWKQKCSKDIRKIKETNRGYKKAFFITSQYTKSNQRSDLEDSLSKETGMDVRILDISWILDQVFKNGYEQIAIDALRIQIDWHREMKIGESDYVKRCRLEELQDRIKNKVDANDIKMHQLDWFLEEAVLSKEIEVPHIESQGLFGRAIEVSKRFGMAHHQFNVHYQYAWATYWWYENILLFEEHLEACLNLAKDINQSGQWGDVVCLLGVYYGHIRNENNDIQLDVEALRSEAKKALTEMSIHDERPSNSLMAKFYLEVLNLYVIQEVSEASEIFLSMDAIVREGDSLIGFPFVDLYNLVSELDGVFGDLESYEALLDYFTERVSSREGEFKGALLWLKRGARRLESGRPYQAIKIIGKSLASLYKKESSQDFYAALNLLSIAYRKVGLLWASRANLLFAASISTDEWFRSGDIVSAQVFSYIRLAKAELMLGRINYALAWWQLACIVDGQFEESILTTNDCQGFDGFLGKCILNTDLSGLADLERLPDVLDRLRLFLSRALLLHVLGYEETVVNEYELEIDEDYFKFLRMVRDTDLGAVTPKIITCKGRYVSLKSSVMGCDITVSFPFRSPLVELGETLLSAIEGFFSTRIVDRVMVVEPKLEIEITADDDDEISVSHELDDSGSVLKMNVLCSSFASNSLLK